MAAEIEVQMVMVKGIGVRAEDGHETRASRIMGKSHDALAVRVRSLPALFNRHRPAILQREAGHIQRVGEGVLGEIRVRLAGPPIPAGIGRSHVDCRDP